MDTEVVANMSTLNAHAGSHQRTLASVIIYLQACIFADVHELSLHFLSVSQFVACMGLPR